MVKTLILGDYLSLGAGVKRRKGRNAMANADGNLFENLPRELPREQVFDLLRAGKVKLERIVSPPGGKTENALPSPWYRQETAEWVMVARGSAAVLFEGEAEPRR